MGYLALYRKYRPNNFDDVVGQNEIVKIISNAIENNKLSHAYLFSGPRGTGKTTTAKIIARMINCEKLISGKPCGKCESCLNYDSNSDVVEIDAASNNGVDEIRELRNKINLVPSNSKYKIYIIDEVHMLTIQAFNALLKTLEEPPSHAIFILATTELHKIPLTVTSRCQKFQFSKISSADIVNRLNKICELEDICIDDNILKEIARLSDGGLRDAINLLDQLISYNSDNILLEDLYKITSIVSSDELKDLLVYIREQNNAKIIENVKKYSNDGKNISKIVEELMVFLKNIMIYNNTNDSNGNSNIVDLSKDYDDNKIYMFITELNELLNKLKISSYPEILLQISLIRLANEQFSIKTDKNIESTVEKVYNEAVNIDIPVKNKVVNKSIIKNMDDNIKKVRIINAFATANKDMKVRFLNDYLLINNYLMDDEYKIVAGLLGDVSVEVVGKNNIIFSCKNEFISERMNNLSNEISNLLEIIYHNKYNVVILSKEEWLREMNTYIKDDKKQEHYKYIEEKQEKIIKKEDIDSPTQKLIDLVGEEMIEYK